MLTKVTAYSPTLSVAPFTFDPDASISSDFIRIKEITGLGPVTASINTSKLGKLNKEAFRDSQTGKRNIVVTFEGSPDWSDFDPEDLRKILTNAFMTQNAVRFKFEDSKRETVEISGYVESLEPNMFSQNSEYQLSVICPDPDFVGIADVIHTGLLQNGVVYSDDPTLQLAIDYPGSVEAGVVLSYPHLSSGAHDVALSIWQKYRSAWQTMYVDDVTFDTTHGVVISTVPGDKYARTTQSTPGPDSSILPKVSTSSQWITLKPGENTLYLGASYNLATTVTITHRNRYGSL